MALTNKQLAAQLGVDHTTISKIRNGHRRPSLDLMERTVLQFPEFTMEQLLAARARSPQSLGQVYDQIAKLNDPS